MTDGITTVMGFGGTIKAAKTAYGWHKMKNAASPSFQIIKRESREDIIRQGAYDARRQLGEKALGHQLENEVFCR